MKEILEAVLTQKAARNPGAIAAIGATQEQFDTWN